MPGARPSNVVAFGPFELHLNAGELRKEGQSIRLQEQPFRILKMLVDDPGGVVGREQIRKTLWPNDTVVEFDHSINAAIKKLRQALGDSADHPLYVETVGRRGYRLMVAAQGVEIEPSAGEGAEAEARGEKNVAGSLSGKLISHYRVLEIIGSGGMGLVYQAEDINLGRPVALKFLPGELAGDAAAIERMRREARAASALNHRNICTIHAIEEYATQPFIVMEMLVGQTLRELLSAGPVHIGDLIDVAVQITEGLDAAHKGGIIHRDIKPANVFITNQRQAKILDFGVAKLLEASEHAPFSRGAQTVKIRDANLTRSGITVGTAAYMSPEQVRGEELDTRTDLFSVGLVLYEMATGRQAFLGETAAELHESILNDTPEPARSVNPQVPQPLADIINKAIEKDRVLRYQTASEMRAALLRLKANTGTIPRVVRFGDFEVDLSAGKLRNQDREIVLHGGPFQVLECLLRRPGEVVSREELQHTFRRGDSLVECEEALNTAIDELRLALGDSADNPRLVESVLRKGYRFIAPVDERQTEEATAATVVSRRRRVRLAVTLFGLTVAAGAAGWWLHTNRTTEQSYVPGPLTSYPGEEQSPTFSPDGNQVAFSWERKEKPGVDHIYVKLIGTYEPMQLTRDEDDDFGPAWSPDGRFIAFLRSLPNGRSGVFLIPAPGGPPRKVAEVWSPHGVGVESPYLSWHPNGKWLVVMDRAVPDEPLALFLLSVETGEKRRLTTPPQRIVFGDVGPAVSPDGRAVVFSRNNHDLFLQELSEDLNPKSQPKQLTFGNRYTASPAWTADGRAIIFSSGTPHSPTLYNILISQPGWRAGKPERLAFAGDGARQPAISRQGRLGYVRFTLDANIWRMKLNGGLPLALPPTKLIASTHLDHTPQYSPDGKRIAFASNRSGSHEIWVCNSDGSGAVQLTSLGSSYYTAAPRWSLDGRQIYFGSNADGTPGAYVIGSEGGRPERLTAENPTRRSHDGKWIYFNSSRTGGRQVWKMPATGGQAIQITRKGGGDAQESLDGRFLYYLKDANEFTSLWKVPVSGGDETQVLESVCCSNFAVVDQGIYFIPKAPPGDNSSLKFLSFATGKVTTLAQFSGLAAYGFSVSPDGRWLLYSQYEQNGADLMLVENFR